MEEKKKETEEFSVEEQKKKLQEELEAWRKEYMDDDIIRLPDGGLRVIFEF